METLSVLCVITNLFRTAQKGLATVDYLANDIETTKHINQDLLSMQ